MLALFIMIFKMQGLGEKGKVYDEAEKNTKVRFKMQQDLMKKNKK